MLIQVNGQPVEIDQATQDRVRAMFALRAEWIAMGCPQDLTALVERLGLVVDGEEDVASFRGFMQRHFG